MNRKIHRWVSFPIAVFMLFIAATGLALQLEELTEEEGPERPAVAAPAALSDAQVATLTTQALAAARQARPDMTIKRIELNWSEGTPQVSMTETGRRGTASIRYDSASAKAHFVPAPDNLHRTLIGLHTGKVAGAPGVAISLLGGAILMILSVTGLIVYLDMWRRRRLAGKAGLFWK